MRRRQAEAPFSPFVFYNPFRIGAGPRPVSVAGLELGDGYMAIEYQLGVSQVVMYAVKRDQMGGRYQVLQEDLGSAVRELKTQALQFGATLEAIQLLGQLTPLTKVEEAQMAATKLAKPDAEGLKTAAKAAPVGGKAKAAAPAAKRGNPEALAAARAARGSPDRTYKVLKTPEYAPREGSWTSAMVSYIVAHTTTAEASKALKSDKNGHREKRLDFKWAEEKGFIKFT